MEDAGVVPGPSKRLAVGDRVRLVAPGSKPTAEAVDGQKAELESWGLVVESGTHVLSQRGIYAGSDRDRLDDLNRALRDPLIRAMFAVRGGAGTYRIRDGVDLEALELDPIPVIGFSDITNLHLAAWDRGAARSIHCALGSDRSNRQLRSILMDGVAPEVVASRSLLSAQLTTSGTASGVLVGGNLRELAGFVGIGSRDFEGCILFLEDLRHVGVGQLDRNLTQLARSGILGSVAGVALGTFDGFDGYEDSGWGALDVLGDAVSGLGVPILGGLRVGHGVVGPDGAQDQDALVFGAPALLDADERRIRCSPAVT